MKILVGVYPDIVEEVGEGAVVTYPADSFPFCVAYTMVEQDGTSYDLDDMPCARYLNSLAEMEEYAEAHFGSGNWEIRDVGEERGETS